MTSPFTPPIPVQPRIAWTSCFGLSASLSIVSALSHTKKPSIIITKDAQTAYRLQRECRFFAPKNTPIHYFPDWEVLPYDHFSPHEDLVSERLAVLNLCQQLSQGIILISLPTLMQRCLPKSYLQSRTLSLAVGDNIQIDSFRHNLTNAGYHHVEHVFSHGEYTVRGSIIDLFPMGSTHPFRIELFDDEVESIRHFDTESQRSTEKCERIRLLPGREYPLDEAGIAHFRQQWREQFPGNPLDCPIYEHISHGDAIAGIEFYLPLFFDELASFFDYLPQDSQLFFIGDEYANAAERIHADIQHRYEQLRHDITRPLCPPQTLSLSVDELFHHIKQYQRIDILTKEKTTQTNAIDFDVTPLPDLQVDPHKKVPLHALDAFIQSFNGRICIMAESAGRQEVLSDLLRPQQLYPSHYDSWQAFLDDDQPLGICIANIEHGVILSSHHIAIITETEFFGSQVKQRRLRKQRQIDPDIMIKNLTELQVGSPVVHIDHGIGRYLGLTTLTTNEVSGEYLTLEYAAADKIYVPVSNLHLVSRYTGVDGDRAPLSRLGTKQWQQQKEKAAKKIRDVAAELLELYSKREASQAIAFHYHEDEYQQFAQSFPFETTPDQELAIMAIIQDIQKTTATDRLVCGDVGFGKTEVAVRAAFMAASNGKQIAVLVPTTLLATQHAQTFQDRFANWPFTVRCLSRLQSKKEQDDILKGLETGQVDIVIGTHKLLQATIQFKDLGLLIIDEEHRFGVRQKEKIKALRNNIDIIALTATPIPRTLNLALTGMRDLSIIATPPARRLSIKTFLTEPNEHTIREAILRELTRGGQVFYLHNDIATIQATADKLQQLVPEARIHIAHGQMRKGELEQIMTQFYHQHFNVLVCTTIIESGIDIPTANTMIVDRADRFGLAQLHQIRGRVGRSHHQAYCYLIAPPRKAMSKDAAQRLDAITSIEDLGAGFNLASHDLEIRGAGEILGDEQSGHIQAIGFSLFMELLEEAVNALQSGNEPTFEQTIQNHVEIDLQIPALIPETLVHDVKMRLTLYKRLANCKNEDEVHDLKAEMIDRFGAMTEPCENLIAITRFKLQAMELGIVKIDMGKSFGYIHFNDKPNIDPQKMIMLIQKQSQTYSLKGSSCLRFKIPTNTKSRITLLKTVLTQIM